VITYGERDGNRRYGLMAAIALHLLLVAVWYFQPKIKVQHAAAKAGEAIVWLPPITPDKTTSKPKADPAPKAAKPAAPSKPTPQPVTQVKRLPDTITLPKEKPVENTPPPPPKEVTKVDPEITDMQAYIDAKRKARGASQSDQAEESQSAKGMRNALANIGAINGRSGQDPNETGGVFSVNNKTFNSADVKFRGWNPNFKRRWLTAVTVERGSDPDIETAIVKKMIELIRKEKTGDFEWDSHRLNRVVTLSARPQDTQELMDFLFKEMFPEYKPPRRGG